MREGVGVEGDAILICKRSTAVVGLPLLLVVWCWLLLLMRERMSSRESSAGVGEWFLRFPELLDVCVERCRQGILSFDAKTRQRGNFLLDLCKVQDGSKRD